MRPAQGHAEQRPRQTAGHDDGRDLERQAGRQTEQPPAEKFSLLFL